MDSLGLGDASGIHPHVAVQSPIATINAATFDNSSIQLIIERSAKKIH
ncbi:MAG: hypothetical protein VW080_11535 [Flavobacteriaceae bacterium]